MVMHTAGIRTPGRTKVLVMCWMAIQRSTLGHSCFFMRYDTTTSSHIRRCTVSASSFKLCNGQTIASPSLTLPALSLWSDRAFSSHLLQWYIRR
ncbi:hypothetical protein BCR37DRAFT_376926 [Protomyces lactucae-debilis]|uniref:Uncharacterized protein n=1 Tax=Protomyces lactucae-debilis TaxID=2754530 RepID=A0A1Y2FT33_PROLT|nr:uncharacterized protein BCR37DRAFT_376923 [Protomyces lactucae-debilis]XP_040727528.1 uncharacterized protein BCR37DRAFT_376925 [Protomyces lactucae-debilis]XP_040727530.1 uncharacterized protein BCR37DRAFT_376926 [Protomyces lactucae-debilis]ORY86344.1 hypothetical protein BCR37DRAFT_376923 [Protomyces lactucae-debilis]ORY86346.1 hypothetical protein BCR37DRAFT_376925 [Protomyces lactucae-debilis]ORY86348.1 hypothetical protein BCR37DRAFT_376926 [Protomyces lactucae-debilis]